MAACNEIENEADRGLPNANHNLNALSMSPPHTVLNHVAGINNDFHAIRQTVVHFRLEFVAAADLQPMQASLALRNDEHRAVGDMLSHSPPEEWVRR